MAHLCLCCEVHTVTSNMCVMGGPGPADASRAECPCMAALCACVRSVTGGGAVLKRKHWSAFFSC